MPRVKVLHLWLSSLSKVRRSLRKNVRCQCMNSVTANLASQLALTAECTAECSKQRPAGRGVSKNLEKPPEGRQEVTSYKDRQEPRADDLNKSAHPLGQPAAEAGESLLST